MGVITEVRLTPVTSPRAGITCGHVVVELVSEDGTVGIGEMSDFQHLPMYHVDVLELERTLSSLLVGADPLHPNAIGRRVEQAFPQTEDLYDKTSLIVCGVDIALWDLRARLLGTGVATLLGGRVRDRMPIAYPIFRQQSEPDVEHNLATVDRLLQRGFSTFRVYVGRDLGLDELFLTRCRDTFGDRVELKSLDFSNLLDAHAAARFIERTRHLGYDFVEAPARVGDVEGLRRVRALARVSEHASSPAAALRMLSAGALDVVNVGLFVLGGITGARRVIAVAESAGVECLIGTTQELAIGTAAAAHVGTTSAAVTAAGDPVGPLLYARDVVAAPLDFRDGCLFPPDGLGLGVELDRDRLAEARDRLTWASTDTRVVIDRTGETRVPSPVEAPGGPAAVTVGAPGGSAAAVPTSSTQRDHHGVGGPGPGPTRPTGTAVVRAALEGVTAVLVAPYAGDRLDEEATERVAALVDRSGIHAMTSLGNTAEVFQLSRSEQVAHLRAVARARAEAVLVAGVHGAASTVLDEIEQAASLGYDAALVHEPPDPFGDSEGLVAYYAEIAGRAALPLVLYVRSGRMDVEALARVASLETVVGIKFARADVDHLAGLLAQGAGADCTWVNGAAEGRAQAFLPLGLTGFTSGIANVRPDLALAVHQALRSGDAEALQRWVHLLAPVEELRAREQGKYNVAVLKELLRGRGTDAGPVRPPHSPLTADGRRVLAAAIASWPEAV